MSFAMIVQVCIALLSHPHVGAASPGQATCATFDEAPVERAAGTRLRHFPGALRIATPLEVRFRKDLGWVTGWGLAPDPRAHWAIVTSCREGAHLLFGLLANLRDARLPIVV